MYRFQTLSIFLALLAFGYSQRPKPLDDQLDPELRQEFFNIFHLLNMANNMEPNHQPLKANDYNFDLSALEDLRPVNKQGQQDRFSIWG